MERIGVIGLGRMGRAIAQRMAAQGRHVTGWTRSGGTVEGITNAPDLGALAANSDTLVLSLFDDAAVAQVLDALLALDIAGKRIIETSTVVPSILQDRIAQITAAGASAVDAPISGGPELVLAGQCGIFVGGADADATRAIQSLKPLSQRIFHIGKLGSGLVMKTINNVMLQSYFNGLAEMMPLAKRAGIPLETALTILSGGPAGIPMVRDRIPKIMGQDKDVGFTIKATAKDADVFARVARANGLEAGTVAAFQMLLQSNIAAGQGDQDLAALIASAYTEG